jgi:voltage-gated potassium channel
MAQQEHAQEQLNVIILAALLAVIFIMLSLIVLWFINGNIYLDVYYILETFFDASNLNADAYISQLAASYGLSKLIPLTIIVIIDNLGRILIISFILAAVFDIISYSNIEDALNRFGAINLKNHIIICGYNSVSESLIQKFHEKKIKFIVLDKNSEIAAMLNNRGIRVINSDFKQKRSLAIANINSAKSVIFTSDNDLENMMGAISARNLNKKVNIIARASKSERAQIMLDLGINKCIMPEYITADYIGNSLLEYFNSSNARFVQPKFSD